MIVDQCHWMRGEVCYSDTDAGGVVAHFNYLRFAEAARAQFVRDQGLSLWRLQCEQKIGFVMRECRLEIREPLRLDDAYTVITQIDNLSRAAVEFVHTIQKTESEKIVAKLFCKMACVGETFRPVRIPEDYLELFTAVLEVK